MIYLLNLSVEQVANFHFQLLFKCYQALSFFFASTKSFLTLIYCILKFKKNAFNDSLTENIIIFFVFSFNRILKDNQWQELNEHCPQNLPNCLDKAVLTAFQQTLFVVGGWLI